jgi:hypothetical protein
MFNQLQECFAPFASLGTTVSLVAFATRARRQFSGISGTEEARFQIASNPPRLREPLPAPRQRLLSKTSRSR